MAAFARTRLVVVVVVLTVPAALYPLVGLWTLAWLPFAVVLLGTALARPSMLEAALDAVTGKDEPEARNGAERGGPEAKNADGEPRDLSDQGDEPAPLTAPRGESGTRGVRVRRTELPSSVDDYAFGFSALIHWRWAHRVDLSLRNPAGPATHAIVLRAGEVLRDVHPGDRTVAESQLEAEFAVEAPVAGGTIQVWAEKVRLELAHEDEERLDRMAHMRKDRALWAAEHEARQVKRSLSGELDHEPAAELAPDPMLRADLPAPHLSQDLPEPGVPMPGSVVDEEGYESYWWPAEQDEEESDMEQDVQVAILRGLIDSVEDEAERSEFAREQVDILRRTGFADVAERVQSMFPER
ncbi:hypothetical protein [Nocardiopsis oceani]